jgi:hypothetical protein
MTSTKQKVLEFDMGSTGSRSLESWLGRDYGLEARKITQWIK